jgi:tetratricopeptide (TPR) repeat protein
MLRAWIYGLPWPEGADLGNLGNAYAALGEVEKAIDYHKQALAIFQAIGDPNADRVPGWLEELREKRQQQADDKEG